jgi:hypothetical protein
MTGVPRQTLHDGATPAPATRAEGDDPSTPEPRNRELGRLLRRLARLARQPRDGDSVTLAEVFGDLGDRSFPTMILIPALVLVSPLSAIPGMTGTLGLTIALLLGQRLFGRRALWVPSRLGRLRIPSRKLETGVLWLRRPAAMLDRLLAPRLTTFADGTLKRLPMSVVTLSACCLPLLEFLPMSGTTMGAAITLYAAGLLARDGRFVLLGASLVALLPLTLWFLLT